MTGKEIKALREDKAVTQEALANISGFKRKEDISEFENGKRDLPAEKVAELAKNIVLLSLMTHSEYTQWERGKAKELAVA